MISKRRKAVLHIKNLVGKSTNRKLVVFSVDDFGNVFLHSKKAKENLIKAGLNLEISRFSKYDILENKEDLTFLYETLSVVKDKNGKCPVFTAFVLPANIDFERVLEQGNEKYHFETLPETFQKLPGYEGTWNLWMEGIKNGFLSPQFHGREHLNVRLFTQLLQKRDKTFLTNLENRSYAVVNNPFNQRVGFTEAFSFDHFEETEKHKQIIKEGSKLFREVFGVGPVHFNAPGAREHSVLEETIANEGMTIMDTDIIKDEHQGDGILRKRYHYLGQKNKFGQSYLYRNCVFEPLLNQDCIEDCMTEIDIAFRHGKPANISSHRVNFVGGIEPKVRDEGLGKLKLLLQQIVKKWPEVEFVTTLELGKELNH